jgi:hypothetical protein
MGHRPPRGPDPPRGEAAREALLRRSALDAAADDDLDWAAKHDARVEEILRYTVTECEAKFAPRPVKPPPAPPDRRPKRHPPAKPLGDGITLRRRDGTLWVKGESGSWQQLVEPEPAHEAIARAADIQCGHGALADARRDRSQVERELAAFERAFEHTDDQRIRDEVADVREVLLDRRDAATLREHRELLAAYPMELVIKPRVAVVEAWTPGDQPMRQQHAPGRPTKPPPKPSDIRRPVRAEAQRRGVSQQRVRRDRRRDGPGEPETL